jgi:hypothetical protein
MATKATRKRWRAGDDAIGEASVACWLASYSDACHEPALSVSPCAPTYL